MCIRDSNEEQQDSILKWGGIAIVAGPLLKTLGTGITTFTKLKGAMGGVSKALGVFGKGASATATVAETAAEATAGLSGAASGAGGALSILSGAALPVAGVIAGVGGAIYTMHEYTDMMNQSVTTSVSYTHLDVYKRQIQRMKLRDLKNRMPRTFPSRIKYL